MTGNNLMKGCMKKGACVWLWPRLAWLPKAKTKCYSWLYRSLPTADGACVFVCVCVYLSVSWVLCMKMHRRCIFTPLGGA